MGGLGRGSKSLVGPRSLDHINYGSTRQKTVHENMEDHARGASWEYDLWISALAHRSVGLPRSTLEFTSSFLALV